MSEWMKLTELDGYTAGARYMDAPNKALQAREKACPYPMGTAFREQWRDGWNRAISARMIAVDKHFVTWEESAKYVKMPEKPNVRKLVTEYVEEVRFGRLIHFEHRQEGNQTFIKFGWYGPSGLHSDGAYHNSLGVIRHGADAIAAFSGNYDFESQMDMLQDLQVRRL